MKDDVGVRRLVESIFIKRYKVISQMAAKDSSFPPCLLTNDFVQKLLHVLSVRKSIIYIKWAADFNVFYDRDILSDPKSYLASIIFNCLKEHKCQSSVFESFLSVCSCVKFYSGETLQHAGLNYCDLNTDIVMTIYDIVLKKIFLRRNGFKRLIEYIGEHKFLEWDVKLVKHVVLADSSSPLVGDMEERIRNEIVRERQTAHSFNFDLNELRTSATVIAEYVLSTTSVKLSTFSNDHESEESVSASILNDPSKLHASTKSMTQKDISTTSVELPILTSDHDSNQMASTSRPNNAVAKDEVKPTNAADLKFEPVEISQGCSSPYAKTYLEAKQAESIAWYESIVQEVIKYNQTKTADLVSSDNSIQKKAGEVLEQLKDTIKSLIDVLDEYDEE